MSIILTAQLKKEYEDLFDSLVVSPGHSHEVEKLRDTIIANKSRYESVEHASTVPWYIVAVIHAMEGSLNFHTHLHNGDPLTAKTVHVPKGRPEGTPPFKWEDSAVDALKFDNMAQVKTWNLATALFKLEGFNGFGYRTQHPEVLTPYLWSYSNHYAKGKFVADGKFDPDAVSKQCGAAVLLHALASNLPLNLPR